MQESYLIKTAAEVLAQRLLEKKWRCVLAESCTGGQLAAALTALPGASAWFDCAFITYSNQSKIKVLDVKASLIEAFGAVSQETALAMVEGAIERSGTHCGIAITGIAGPDGGSLDKPVGTVWIAWGVFHKKTKALKYTFTGDRAAVQNQAVLAGLDGMVHLLDESFTH